MCSQAQAIAKKIEPVMLERKSTNPKTRGKVYLATVEFLYHTYSVDLRQVNIPASHRPPHGGALKQGANNVSYFCHIDIASQRRIV